MKRLSQTILSTLLICLLGWVLSTCSSDESVIPPSNPGNPNVPGAAVTDETRLVVLAECQAKVEELNNIKKLEDKILFVVWLLQQPVFQGAGFLPESNNVYAVFTDGRTALFTDTPKTNDPPDGGRKRGGGTDGSRLKDVTGTLGLPKSNRVSLYNGMGSFFGDNTVAIEKIFGESKTRYVVTRKTATIENLKRVSGDGVFYLFTHGGGGAIPNPPPRKDSTFVMSFWTTDEVTFVNEQNYKQDLSDKRLAYMLSTFDNDKPVWHYGITGEFINQYMSFAENCIIYMDACNGFRERPTGEAFRKLVLDKVANKKGTYIGWTFETNEYMASQASQFIFDRLLGTNTTGPGATTIPKEDPIQRPFDLDRIFSNLSERHFDVCANGATIKYESRLDDDILLTPTIEKLEIDEYTSTLQIFGSFGTEKGKVYVNEVEITDISDWTPIVIICKIPEEGNGSAGDVIVKVNDHDSNPVPLTEWKIKLNYASDDNGVRMEGAINLVIRADTHPRRTKPGEKPSLPELVDYGPSSGNMFGNSSNATYAIGGQKNAQCSIAPCTSYFEETPLVRSGTAPYMKFGGGINDPKVVGFYNWTADRKTIKIDFLDVSLPKITTTTFKARYKCPASDEEVKDQALTSMNFTIPTNEIGDVIKLEIADNYNIRSGSYSKNISRPWNPCDGSGTYKVLVTWDLVRPNFAPTDMTPARMRTADQE